MHATRMIKLRTKKAVLFICLLSLIITQFGSAFDCDDIPTESLCESIDGCEYHPSSSSCKGDIVKPSCGFEKCIYIYNPDNSTKESGEGTLSEPYTSLNQVPTSLSSSTKVIIINPKKEQYQYPLDQTIFAPHSFSLTTLFTKSNPSTIKLSETDRLETVFVFNQERKGDLNYYFQNLVFTGLTELKPSITLILQVAGSLKITNVAIKDLSLENFIQLKDSSVNITGLYIENSNYHCSFNGKFPYHLTDITIKNIGPEKFGSLALFGNSTDIMNVYVENVTRGSDDMYDSDDSSLFYITDTSSKTKSSILNITVKNTTRVQPIFASQVMDFILKNTSIDNALYDKQGSLISIKGIDYQSSFELENVTITNSQVNEHAISYSNGEIKADYITIHNLTKIDMTFNLYFQRFILGVCLYLHDVQADLKHLVMTNVNHNCIVFKDCDKAEVTGSIFDNQNLKLSPNELNPTQDNEMNGVSWLIFESTELPGRFYIYDSIFNSNKKVTSKGGAISIIAAFPGNVLFVKNAIILNTIAQNGGGISYDYFGQNSLTLLMTIITQSVSYQDGGAMVTNNIAGKKSKPSLEMLIKYSTIVKCAASNQGGAFKFIANQYKSQSMLVYGNTANYGGAISLIFMNTFSEKYNSYLYNQASILGGKLFDLTKVEQSTQTDINKGNRDPKNQSSHASKPVGYKISVYAPSVPLFVFETQDEPQVFIDKGQVKLEQEKEVTATFNYDEELELVPGHGLQKLFKIEVIDDEGNVVQYINNERLVASLAFDLSKSTVKQTQKVIAGSQRRFQNGTTYIFTDLILAGEANTSQTLVINGENSGSNILSDLNLLLNIRIKIKLLSCQIGDKYHAATQTCDQCPQGTYSLEDPFNTKVACNQCPGNFICAGGSQMGPVEGFYRYDNTTSTSTECPIKEACLGALSASSQEFDQHGFCKYPNEGNLCSSCADGFARVLSQRGCISCTDTFFYYMRLFMMIFTQLLLILIFVTLRSSQADMIKRGYEENDEDARKYIEVSMTGQAAIKVIMNFNQTVAIINSYNINWPEVLSDLYIFVQNLVPTIVDEFSVECMVKSFGFSKDTIFFLNYISLVLEPIILFGILAGGYSLILCISKRKIEYEKKKKTFEILFILVGFFFQPNIIKESLKMFYCINLGDEEKPALFMKTNPEIQCWSNQHLFWSFSVSIPAFIIWGIILPVFLFRKVRRCFNRDGWYDTLAMYSFIAGGYQDQYYWWEFIVMLRKILIILVLVGLNGIFPQGQILVTGFILTFATLFHISFQPFRNSELNHLETVSLASTTAMTACELYFVSITQEQARNSLGYFLSTGAVVITAYFLIRGFIMYLSTMKHKALRMKQRLIDAWVKKAQEKQQKQTEDTQADIDNLSSSVELPPIHTEASKREDIEKKNGDGDNDDDDGNDLEKTTRKKSKTAID